MIKIKLKQLIMIGTLTFASITSKAQITNFLIKIPYNINTKEIIAEPTETYNLPFDISGFTFVDLYKGAYYGQTDLIKPIKKMFNLKSRTIHNNQIHTKTGVGINKDLELFNNKLHVSGSILPIWFDNKHFLKRQTADYFFNLDLGSNWSVNGFGEWELKNKKITWVYGEIDIGKDIKKYRISYSPTINKNKNKKGININHRISLTYIFK